MKNDEEKSSMEQHTLVSPIVVIGQSFATMLAALFLLRATILVNEKCLAA